MISEKEFQKYKIPKIELPKGYDNKIKGLTDKLEVFLKNSEFTSPSNSDQLFDEKSINQLLKNGPPVPDWFNEFKCANHSNEIVDSLNIVIYDLLMLRDFPILTGKPHSVRVTFLYRSFFNECYRAKELFNVYTKQYYSANLINKTEMKEIRNRIYKAIEGPIKFRNQLTHQLVDWNGKAYNDFLQLEAIKEGGYMVVNRETGKEFNSNELLSKICDEYLEICNKTGTHLSTLMTKTIQLLGALSNKERKESTE